MHVFVVRTFLFDCYYFFPYLCKSSVAMSPAFSRILINTKRLLVSKYSKTSVARTLNARLPQLFRTRSRAHLKNPKAADLKYFWAISFLCRYVVSKNRLKENENTQPTFMLRKIENISLLCLLAWRYD